MILSLSCCDNCLSSGLAETPRLPLAVCALYPAKHSQANVVSNTKKVTLTSCFVVVRPFLGYFGLHIVNAHS